MGKLFAVSARKFRPQTFSQIVGQKHIVQTLSNALDRNRIAHAYLFSGTRGVGKTTTARVLAKALNCESGPTSKPCQKCGNCVEIAAGSSLDVMEIDGATNTGIDNIRDLKESVMFMPTKSRYKVYIIDEVHQISPKAFDALLKTLEEPPPHVIFMFATTALTKVPETILSRCQCFEYKPIAISEITIQLKMIAEKENVNATPEAIEAMARRARGSMRDAQSMFDQSAAYGGGTINENDVKLILGLVEKAILFDMVGAIVNADKGAVLGIASSVGQAGSDLGLFLEDLAIIIRNILVAKLRPDDLAAYDEVERAKLLEWGTQVSFDEVHRYFSLITFTFDRIRYSNHPQITLEMGLLRLLEGRGMVSIDSLAHSINNAIAETEKKVLNQPAHKADEFDQSANIQNNLEPAPKEVQKAVAGQQNLDLCSVLKSSVKPMLASMLDHAEVQQKGDVVVIKVEDLYQREQLDGPENKKQIEDVCRSQLHRNARVVIEYQEKKKDRKLAGDALKEKNNAVKKQVMELPIIQDAMEIFNGEVSNFKIKRQM
jgi:DNA polymerase-3 subunit gamma/tau